MFTLYFVLLFVSVSLVVLSIRDRVLNDCVDRLYTFNYMIDANLVQIATFEAAGLDNYAKFYRDQIENLDCRIKREARLYKALI